MSKPAASAWKGLRVLLTGATGGIGRVVAEQLAAGGATVLVQGRDVRRVEELASTLRDRGGRVESLVADFSSLGEVASIAREPNMIDVLINNAGVGFGAARARRELSRDGFELRMAINYYAPYVLSHTLAERGLSMRAIVNVASIGQAPVDLADMDFARTYEGVLAYRRSKLALVMLTFDLAAQRQRLGINALHPGTYLDTGMVREAGITPQGTALTGAQSVLHVLDASLGGTSGRYFNEKSEARADAQAYDAAARAQLEAHTRARVSRFL